MSFVISVFEPKMLDDVAQLRHAVFGGSLELNREYLTWKYFHNPYLSEPLLHVAHKDGEIVGMRGWFGTSWHIPGESTAEVIPCAAESAILAHHRHQGLFRKLTRFAMDDLRERGFPVVISMSATPGNYALATAAMGWKSAGSYESLVWSSDAERDEVSPDTESRRPSARLRSAVKSTRGVARLAKVAKQVNDRLTGLSTVAPFQDLEKNLDVPRAEVRMEATPSVSIMAEIASASDDSGLIHHTRDETYFDWRYRDPRWVYRFAYPSGDSQPAFCVLSGARQRPIRIVDWSGDNDALCGLIEKIVTVGAPRRIDTWGKGLPQDLRQRLEGGGFHPDPAEKIGGLLIRPTHTNNEPWTAKAQSLLDINQWSLRMILSDRY